MTRLCGAPVLAEQEQAQATQKLAKVQLERAEQEVAAAPKDQVPADTATVGFVDYQVAYTVYYSKFACV